MQILRLLLLRFFPFHVFNWKSNFNNNQQGIKEERKSRSDFGKVPFRSDWYEEFVSA
ncbi:hypothetical protein LguiB_036151 [Lonicera macranthoides]